MNPDSPGARRQSLGKLPSSPPQEGPGRCVRGNGCPGQLQVATVDNMDAEALTWARQAQEQLIHAEESAEAARADFRRAVLRLAADGSSPQDIAAALGLSGRQLDEIARAAGDPGRGQAPDTWLACTFCGRSQRRARKLIAGPGVYICDVCVELADGVCRSAAAGTPPGPIHAAPEQDSGTRCRFCAKRRDHVTGMAAMPAAPGDTFAGPAAICAECLVLCNGILTEELALDLGDDHGDRRLDRRLVGDRSMADDDPRRLSP